MQDKDEITDMTNYISNQQIKALRDLIPRLKPLETGIITRIVPWFKYFGIDHQTIDFILDKVEHYHNSTLSTEQLKKHFANLRLYQPHAYNLIQICADMIRDVHKHCITLDLPYHLFYNQIKASQSRMPQLSVDTSILNNSIHFVYCSICGLIYSLVMDWHSVYKQSYTHGLRDVFVEYTTDKIYCRLVICK